MLTLTTWLDQGFPGRSAGKESAYNAGNPSSILGSWRSAGEGIGYPLQYSWASLVAHGVKNPPAMQETCVQSLGWEDPLKKGKAIHSSILTWRIPWTVESMGLQSQTRMGIFHFHLAEIVFVRFLYCKATPFSPFHTVLFVGTRLCIAHT